MKEEDKNIEFANRVLNHREELSEEEVSAWLEERENRRLLDELADIKRKLQRKDYSALKAVAWGRLQSRIRGRRVVFRRWISVAAMVACFIGGGLWFWMNQTNQKPEWEKVPVAQIKAGKACAELILAGGKSVPLNIGKSEIETEKLTGIRNDSVKGLDYSKVVLLDEAIKTDYNVLRVPVGGFYKLELPDGTKVWLNAASELKFPVQFNDDRREVYLKGEGYFEVAKDLSHQFVVHLKNSAVTVLGTKFNISAYEEEDHIYTTLAEGAVSFYSELNKQQVTLQPGMQSTMNNVTGLTQLSEVDPSVYTSWVNGSFVFHSLKLETIMRQLQRWYDFEIFYQNFEVKEYTFRGVVNRDMDFGRVLKMIERTTDVHFNIDHRTVVVSKKFK